MRKRNRESGRGRNREANWQADSRSEQGWSNRPVRNWGNQRQNFGAWNRAGGQRDDWREGFRGGFGNSGQMSETAYHQGGFGGGYPGPMHGWSGQSQGGFGWGSGYEGGWRGDYEGRDFENRGYENYPPGGGDRDRGWNQRSAGGYGGPESGYDYPGEFTGQSDYDQNTAGPYAGRGPRGYQRSDERVHEEVCERLTEHGAIDATDIEVRIEAGEITLEGTVLDRRSKRLAEDIAESTRGVRDVHNRLRVSTRESEQNRSFSSGELERENAADPSRRETGSPRNRGEAEENEREQIKIRSSSNRAGTTRR